jgi:hypothetical protein
VTGMEGKIRDYACRKPNAVAWTGKGELCLWVKGKLPGQLAVLHQPKIKA